MKTTITSASIGGVGSKTGLSLSFGDGVETCAAITTEAQVELLHSLMVRLLGERQLHLLWAVLEIKALDAEHGDHDDGLVEFELLTEMPTAEELRELATWAKGFLTPEMGSNS